jgi:hypothetical protein
MQESFFLFFKNGKSSSSIPDPNLDDEYWEKFERKEWKS